jgi:glycosyltransferase involved in cell wall biosynthesis
MVGKIGSGMMSSSGDQNDRPVSISVVIPAKNEEKNIAAVLAELPSTVTEVLLVDGRSTDRTIEVARHARPDIVIVQERRPGKGSALRAGFAAATGDIIVMLDADGSMIPDEIARFVTMLQGGFDFVKGSRFMTGGSSEDITLLRTVGHGLILHTGNLLFRTNFTDLCYGYCAFWREHLDVLALDAEGFEIETQLVLRAVRTGLRVAEVPSTERERANGVSNLNTFRDGVRVMRTMASERTRPGIVGKAPIHAPKKQGLVDVLDLSRRAARVTSSSQSLRLEHSESAQA